MPNISWGSFIAGAILAVVLHTILQKRKIVG